MVIHKKDEDIKGTPLSYRPDNTVLDCTVRDGTLINGGHFEDDFVETVGIQEGGLERHLLLRSLSLSKKRAQDDVIFFF